MKKYIVLLLAVTSFNIKATAQANGVVVPGKWSNQIFISDVNGRPFENKYNAYTGTILNNDEYQLSDVTLSDGRVFHHVKTKIDLLNNQMIFMLSEGKVGILGNGDVKEIAFFTVQGSDKPGVIFRTGLPKIDWLTPLNFYQVLVDGKFSLLKSITKHLVENKNELSGEVSRFIETVENFYIYQDGKMARLKKDREAIFDIFGDRKKDLLQFKQDNNIDLKKVEDLIRLFEKANEK